ncbi:MAG: hypothetical protein C0606_06945 [Hyphomicrobiales bacterium]|nr:MAG: hypothetical protein C0606_06945 [Hyphomicrobiales bacterium]
MGNFSCNWARITAAVFFLAATSAHAAPEMAPWTDDLVASLVKRDAKSFTDGVIARMPDSYAKVKQQVAGSVAGFQGLVNGLQPVAFDPAHDSSITPSIVCRSYFVHGQNTFSLIFHIYRPSDTWYLLSFDLQQQSPENHATYVRRMCEDKPPKATKK